MADIDSRILQAVSHGKHTRASIISATSFLPRVVDRSLQRLRKSGKISYGEPGWAAMIG